MANSGSLELFGGFSISGAFQMKTAFFTVGLCLCATTTVMADVPLPQAVSAFFSTQNKKDCEAWVDLFDDNFEVCVMTALAHLGLHCRGITARRRITVKVQDPVGSTPVKTKKELLAGCQALWLEFRDRWL